MCKANIILSGLSNAFSSGIFLGIAIFHLLPEANEGFEKYFKKEKMEGFIQSALKAADDKNITGKETTPFILKFIADATGGESLESNIALVFNNAVLGARIAVALN